AALQVEGRFLEHDPPGVTRRELLHFNGRRVARELCERDDARLDGGVVVARERGGRDVGKPGKRLVIARAAALELAARARLLALAFHRALEPLAIERELAVLDHVLDEVA